VAAGHDAGRWTTRGIGLGGKDSAELLMLSNSHEHVSVIAFAAFIHGITPRAGVFVMNVSCLLHLL
jgi:solute carrier family 7 (L-type amino acid transporter), member 9/15